MADNNIIISDPSKASSKEVARIIASLVRSMKEMRDSLVKEIGLNSNSVKVVEKSLNTAIKDLTKQINDSAKEIKDKAYKDLNAEVYKLEKLISEVPQFSPTQLEEKFGAVIQDLEQRFNDKVEILDVPMQTPIEIRDSLETLSGEERLSWEAVNGMVGIHVGNKPPEDKRMLWVSDK